MNAVPVPSPPEWAFDWRTLESLFPALCTLESCPQDPIHHAEGNVATHTRMACEALLSSTEYRQLDADRRTIAFLAVLLHDLGKPRTTRDDEGRITSPGHAVRSAILARKSMWQAGVAMRARELVCSLIRRHHLPFFAIDRDDPRYEVIEASIAADCRLLALVAEADARGRRCSDRQRLIDQVDLFRETCREHGCWDGPRVFSSDDVRFEYLQARTRHPDAPIHVTHRCEVLMTSGLPGSGKDHWLAHHAANRPVVSLDDIRAQLGVDPAGAQGSVVARAKELAREHLRAGRDFAWNATNLSRKTRLALLSLFRSYEARVRIVHVEVPLDLQRSRNRARDRIVPDEVVERMIDRWEAPERVEAHQVDWTVTEP